MMERFDLTAAGLVCAVDVIAALGCASAPAAPPAQPTQSTVRGTASYRERIELPASYMGDLPCADCEGIRYHSVLSLVPERLIGVWPGETCGARLTTAELAETSWTLTRLGDAAVFVTEQTRWPNLTLGADGRAAGFTGCNRMAGSYQIAGRSITFGQLASTKTACVDGMEHEAAFAAALDQARSYRILGQHLDLFGAGGEVVARFEAGTAP